MTQTTAGWTFFIVALGMMASLLSADIARLTDWGDVFRPAFVALFLAHFGAVVTAFFGGKIIPPERSGRLTRATDQKLLVKE